MGLYNFLVAFPRLESVLHWPIPGIIKFRRSRASSTPSSTASSPAAAPSPARSSNTAATSSPCSWPPATKTATAPTTSRACPTTSPRRSPHHLPRRLRDRRQRPHLDLVPPLPEPRSRRQVYAEVDAVLGTGTPAPPPSPTTPPPATPSRSSPNPCASTRPPGPWAASPPCPIELGPYRFPPGAHFFFSQYIMHRAAEFCPDPLRFRPERHTPEAKAARPSFTYFPFGGGRRQCIGEGFAWMEGVLSLATIAQRWRLTFLPDLPRHPPGQNHPPPQAPHDDAPRPPAIR